MKQIEKHWPRDILLLQRPPKAVSAHRRDKRIVKISVYLDGWVPNSYSWPAEGTRVDWERNDKGYWIRTLRSYDRKRSNGEGPFWVAFSKRNGRLASCY